MQKYQEDKLYMNLEELIQKMQKRILSDSKYFGVKAVKSPVDMWVYHEIIYDLKPDFLIEIGVFEGGDLLYFAHLMDQIGSGSIIGIDIETHRVPNIVKDHPRIEIIKGEACSLINDIEKKITSGAKIMIIEDSAHTYDNTLNVLNTYNHLVSKDSYFIVEDTACWHGLEGGPSPGPYEAVEDFVNINDKFEIDRTKEAFFITWNPKGFLKRIK